MRRQAGRIDDFMDCTTESNLWRIAKKTNQRIIDVAAIAGTFSILVSVRGPAKHTASGNIISSNQVITVGRYAEGQFSQPGKIASCNSLVGVENENPWLRSRIERDIPRFGKRV